MPGKIPLRAATPDEFPRISALLDLGFGVAPSEEGEVELEQWLEHDRT